MCTILTSWTPGEFEGRDPQSGGSWRCLETLPTAMMERGRDALGSSGQRPGTLLSTVRCAGWPRSRQHPRPQLSVPPARWRAYSSREKPGQRATAGKERLHGPVGCLMGCREYRRADGTKTPESSEPDIQKLSSQTICQVLKLLKAKS